MKTNKKILIIEEENTFLKNREGQVLEQFPTANIIKNTITPKQFGCRSLIIEIQTPLIIFGGIGCIIRANVRDAKAVAQIDTPLTWVQKAKAWFGIALAQAIATTGGAEAHANSLYTEAIAEETRSKAYANSIGSKAFARGEKSEAFANGAYSQAFGCGIGSKVFARGEKSEAFAMAELSRAVAGASAKAVALHSKAYAYGGYAPDSIYYE